MRKKSEETCIINKTTIHIYDTSDIDDININGATLKMLKHSKRYNEIKIPRKIIDKILMFSLMGQNCEEHHLDMAQRLSLYDAVENLEDPDPYVEQFIKETKVMMKW